MTEKQPPPTALEKVEKEIAQQMIWIAAKEVEIEAAKRAEDRDEVSALRRELEQLRDEKKLLQQEKIILLKQASQPSAALPPAQSSRWQRLSSHTQVVPCGDTLDLGPFASADLVLPPPMISNKIYVREAYVKLAELIMNELAQPQPVCRIGLTGTPGVGKSVFLWYLAHRVLLDSRFNHWKLVYTRPGKFYTLARDGSVLSSIVEPTDLETNPNLLLLCDGKVTLEAPVGKFVVWASSPKHDPFKEFLKDKQPPYCMPPWSGEELVECAAKLELQLEQDGIGQRYRDIGGVARYVLNSTIDVRALVDRSLTRSVVEDALRDHDFAQTSFMRAYEMKTQSHLVFHMYPNDDFMFDHIDIASTYVFEQLLTRQDLISEHNLSRFLANPAEHAFMWEEYCNHVVKRGGTFKCAQRPDGLVLQTCDRVVRFLSANPPSPEPDALCIPYSRQFPCIDAYTSEYMFQHTAAKRHPAGGDKHKNFKAVLGHFATSKTAPAIVYCVPVGQLSTFCAPHVLGCSTLVIGIETSIIRERTRIHEIEGDDDVSKKPK